MKEPHVLILCGEAESQKVLRANADIRHLFLYSDPDLYNF